MLRFMLKRTEKDAYSGYEGVAHETVDIDVPELEALLKRGGHGQSGYDYTEIAGVQFLSAHQECGGGG